MKQLLILAGLAVLASTAPANAKPKAYGYGAAGCPPGLAKKNNGCLPPGQAKKLYGVGYRFDRGFNGWTPYNQIPYDLRRQYGLNPYDRNIYDQNYIYQVDPTTYAVGRVLDAILR
jgi:hypothetical protein